MYNHYTSTPTDNDLINAASTPAPTESDIYAVPSKQNERFTLEEFGQTQMDSANEQEPVDSMLAKYLDRGYWERKRRVEVSILILVL